MISYYIDKHVNSELIKKIIESFFGKASFTLFTMIFSLVCTRLYGAEIFGKYTYAFTIISLVMILCKAGLDNGLMYYIPKYGNKYVSLSFFVNFIFSLIIIIIISFFVRQEALKLMLPLIWLVSAERIFLGLYRANEEIKEFYYINGFFSIILRIILTIIFYFILGRSVYSIIISVYISYFFSNIIYFYSNRDEFKEIVYEKDFLKYSFPLVIAAIMAMITNKIDIVMLGSMKGNESVGIYQIVSQLSKVITVILSIFNIVFAPKISQLYHSNKIDELRRIYSKSTRLLGLISLIIVVLMLIFSKYILLIFGKEFIKGQTALIFRGIGQFINAAVGSVWFMLSMTGKPKTQMYSNLFASIINVVLNILFIPKYGIDGAAFASMIAVGSVNVLGYVLVTKEFKVKPYKLF